MDIGSITFNLIFLPLACLVYYLTPKNNRTARNVVLLIFSLLFYAWGSIVYTGVLLVSIICNYYLGRGIGSRVERSRYRAARNVLEFAILINVMLIVFFGYFPFITESLDKLFGSSISGRSFASPLGLGIYTLSAIVYLAEVYRGRTEAERNILVLALYISMFPKITGGPIVSYNKLKSQILKRKDSDVLLGSGIGRFIIGLTKLVFIAAYAGKVRDSIAMDNTVLANAWLGVLATVGQFYFTWSGFADMAVGMGRMFGFELGENFRYPILSRSHNEFWKRWNVSVSSFFKGYVVRPFGRSSNMRAMGYLVAWALYGLWYGPGWGCLVGGVYFAAFILLENGIYGRGLHRLPAVLQYIYMIITVGVGAVFFAEPTLEQALTYIANMFGAGSGIVDSMTLYYLKSWGIFFLIMILCSLPLGYKWKKKFLFLYKRTGTLCLSILYALLFVLCICWIV